MGDDRTEEGSILEIKAFDESYIPGIVSLWNRSCTDEMPYKPFTAESFRKKFIENTNFEDEGTFVGVEDDEVIGFANGLYLKEFLPGQTHENTPGYLTFVLVKKEFRRRGYGSALLESVERFLRAIGKKKAQVIFFNPINLEWYIPGTGNRHDHPNAPGADIDGPGFEFLLAKGYTVRTKEVSLHLDLEEFRLGEKAAAKIDELKAKGVEISYYDSRIHHSLDELFDALRNEDWRKGVKDNLQLPLVVASDQGKIVAFAGPIKVQESGRGWFVGVGTHPEYEGRGIGTSVYLTLLDGFKRHGAKFSTIFTGIENPALKMYDRAGYSKVKTWAVMQKEL